jgi:Fur family transcriptional regulator, ferric uptake regulator
VRLPIASKWNEIFPGVRALLNETWMRRKRTVERDTTQRRLIRRLLHEADRPLSPREVLLLAQKEKARLGMATIYRNLNALIADGWLIPVELPGEATRYELSGKAHHHHFRCRACANVFEIEGCALRLRRHVPRGFKVEAHEVILYGLCSGCSGRNKPTKQKALR